MKRLLTFGFGLGLGVFGAAWAQGDPATALRELLGSGYYALAAQVEGPRAVQTAPQNAEAHLLYARALYLVGNLSAARTQLEQAKTLSTTQPASQPATQQVRRSVTHLDALIRAAQGDAARATRLLERVFKAAPDYQVAMDWGQVAWQSGDLGKALRAYRAAAATPAGQTEPWPTLNIARLLLQQGRYEAALTPLEATLTRLEQDATGQAASLRPSPAYPEVFYRLGQAHEALGEVQEAVSNYQAARSADPAYTPAADALARLDQP